MTEKSRAQAQPFRAVNPGSGAHGAPVATYTEFETFTLVRPRSDGNRRAGALSAAALGAGASN